MAGLAVFAALLAGTWLASPNEIEDAAEPPPPSVPELDDPQLVTPSPTVVTPEGDKPPVTLPPQEPVVVAPPEGPEPDGGVVALPPQTAPPSTEPPATAAPPATSPPVAATTLAPTDTTPPADTTPPVLAITYPEHDARFDEKRIRFTGTTEPGASVTVGRYEAKVDDDGNWSIVLVLFEGGNRALFRATDGAGNEQTARITVYYEPPPPVTEPPPPDVDFTAYATFGSCSEDPPYDVYYGKAKPGSKVSITSAYGSGQTFADGEGHWEVKVFFPEAPPEKVFLVTVRDEFGSSKKFEFVSYLLAD